MAIRSNIAGLVSNAAHALDRCQMAPEQHAPTCRPPDIRLRVNKANNTLSIVYPGIGMNEQGLADIVTASLVVRKVTVRTKDSNGCQYKCESMEDGSFDISKDDNAEHLHRGTEITLFLCENQLEYLEEDVIKDLVEKECGSVGYTILYLKVVKEPEVNEGEIQEEVTEEWQVIHEPKVLGPSNNPLVANVNIVAETGAKDPNAVLCAAAKEHLTGKVDDAIMAGPGSFVADIPCQIKDKILEMNPNNEKVKKLIKIVERGESETVELAMELLYDNAIILNKAKKPVWKRMIDRLCTCVITHCALATAGALESALDGDGDACPF